MASIKRIKASDGTNNASVATVTAIRAANATTQHVDTVAGIYAGSEGFYATMGTPHTFTDPVTGETITEISEASAVNFQGHIDTGNIIIDAIEPGYTDAGSAVGDIVIIRPTTSWADNVADVLAEAHDDDGKLKAAVPVTNATALTVEPLTGWINDPNTFVYVSGTGTITAVFKVVGVDVTDHLQAGMPFALVQGGVTKYGFITKIAFSTDTTITALMAATNGTVDNSGVANATITSFKFGLPFQPGFGFPLDENKWTVSYSLSSDTTSAGQVGYAQIGSAQLAIPIGIWKVIHGGTFEALKNSATDIGADFALSTSTSSASDSELIIHIEAVGATATLGILVTTFTPVKTINLSSATTYYLIMAGAGTAMGVRGAKSPYMIKARCAYLP